MALVYAEDMVARKKKRSMLRRFKKVFVKEKTGIECDKVKDEGL